MNPTTSTDYYERQRSNITREFAKVQATARTVLPRHVDAAQVDRLVDDSGIELARLIPQLPYIGGEHNRFTRNLVQGAFGLALARPLERQGLAPRQIGHVLYDVFEAYIERLPRLKKWVEGKIMGSVLGRAALRKAAEQTQRRHYPEDWVMETLEGDRRTFDSGFDITECGIVKFLRTQGAERYAPYICLADYAMFRAWGLGLQRTQTIANGAPVCDFRITKHGQTPSGWPPEKLREFTASPGSGQAE